MGYPMACMFTGPNGSGFLLMSVSQLCTTSHMEFEGHFMGLTPQSYFRQTILDLLLYSYSKSSYIINKSVGPDKAENIFRILGTVF